MNIIKNKSPTVIVTHYPPSGLLITGDLLDIVGMLKVPGGQ